jgi:hypothetical protein
MDAFNKSHVTVVARRADEAHEQLVAIGDSSDDAIISETLDGRPFRFCAATRWATSTSTRTSMKSAATIRMSFRQTAKRLLLHWRTM